MDGSQSEPQRQTGWSAADAPLPGGAGLVVPQRTTPATARTGSASSTSCGRCATCGALRRRDQRPRLCSAPAPRARAPGRGRDLAPRQRRRGARLGAAKARAAARRMTLHSPDEREEAEWLRRRRHDVKDLALAEEGVRRIEWADQQHARARRDPRALRERAAARRLPHLRLPARHDRDGQPGAHAEGGRRRRRALRVQPAVDPGRRRRRARRGVRRLGLRHQGRGQRHVLPAHRGRGRPQAADHDGRRRRRDRRAARRTAASSSATSSAAPRRRPRASSA